MSGFLAPQGLPLGKGQRLQIAANYDNHYPHARVMGIYGVYFAPDPTVTDGCGPLPPIEARGATSPGRSGPPRFKVPLARRPHGRVRKLRNNATIHVRDFSFKPERIRVRTGTTLRWKFEDYLSHDVTVANGPRAFSSPYMSGGRVFRQRLKTPGTYRLFCTIHPMTMTQEIRVTRR
jgi:plastocyanin